MPVQKGLLTSAVLSTSQNNLKLFRIKIGGFKLLTAPVPVIVHGCVAIDLNGSEMGSCILSWVILLTLNYSRNNNVL